MDPKLIRYSAIGLLVVLVFSIGYYAYLDTLNPIDSLPDQGKAPEFTLVNTEGQNVSLSDSDGKVRILSFIYTKCNMGCATITYKMSEIGDAMREKGEYNHIQLITIDFDYMFDNRTVLKTYRDVYTGDDDSWQFLLGNEEQTMNVTGNYNFHFELDTSVMNMTTTGNDTQDTTNMHADHQVVYIHPFIVWFIDQQGRIRAAEGGLNWTLEHAVDIIDFLLNE